jgi:diguanylate cyclase (GGDEF)-like protein
MASSRARVILGAFCLISFAFSAYSLAFLSIPGVFQPAPYWQNLITTVIFSFNISIVSAWTAFGFFGGAAIGGLSSGVVLLLALRSGMGGYPVFVLSFFLTSVFGFLNRRRINSFSQSYGLRLEKLSEESNILSDNINRKKEGITALEEKMLRYHLLKEVAEALSSTLSLESIKNIIIDKALSILGKDARALLFLVDAEKQELALSASMPDIGPLTRPAGGGTHPELTPGGDGGVKFKAKKGDAFDRRILKQRKALFVENVETDFRFSTGDIEEAGRSFSSLIAAPIVSENRLSGILRLDSARPSAFAQDDLRLLGIIADLGAVAIENAALYARTQELAIRDALTGLFVRRYFLERFREEVIRAARKRGCLSLVLIDIDRFKDYNDRFGHAAGDLVLKFVARQLEAVMRPGDIAVRYGGEEFGVLLYGIDGREAAREARRIHAAIRSKPLVFRRSENIITVSIGVSGYPKDAGLEDELIRIADERLYKAKELGRDRVCSE